MEFSNVFIMIQSVIKDSFTLRDFDEVENGDFSFHQVNDLIKNNEVESNAPKNKNQSPKNIVSNFSTFTSF